MRPRCGHPLSWSDARLVHTSAVAGGRGYAISIVFEATMTGCGAGRGA